MKNTNRKSKVKIYGLTGLIILAVVAAGLTYFTLKPKNANATAKQPDQGQQKTTGKPEFSFSGATDWSQGPTDKVSMALFHSPHDCFTSIEHKTGTTAAAKAELQKTQADLTRSGYTFTQGTTRTVAMEVNTVKRQFELSQSSVTTPKGSYKIKGGQEFGYVQLPNGYLEIEGYCDASDQLPATIPALEAIKFDAN